MPINIKSAADFWARVTGDSATAGDGTINTAPARFDHGNSDIGATTDSSATTDAGTFSLVSLMKRLLSKFSASAALSDTDGNPTTTSVGAKAQLWDGTQWLRQKQAVTGSITSLIGIPNVAPLARYNATLLTLTDGDHRALQLDANGNLKTTAQGLVFDGSAFQLRRQAVTGSITSLIGITNVVGLGRYNATIPTLTDGDHRALQVDVNGNLRTSLQGFLITTCTGSSAAATSTSGVVLAANSSRKSAVLTNAGNVDVFLRRGATAIGGQGILLKANGGNFEITPSILYTGVLSAITLAGTSSLAIEEGV